MPKNSTLTSHTQKVPNHQQWYGSFACGPVSLQNIEEHLGQKKSVDEILKKLNRTSYDDTVTPELARYLHTEGYETILLSSNFETVSLAWKDASREELIANLQQWLAIHPQHYWLKDAQNLLSYLQEGGELKIVHLSTRLIDEYLRAGYVLLACVHSSWIWEKRKKNDEPNQKSPTYDEINASGYGHFVVIFDQEGEDYIISDPYPTKLPGKEGVYPINKDQLLVSNLVWSHQMLAVKNKKRK